MVHAICASFVGGAESEWMATVRHRHPDGQALIIIAALMAVAPLDCSGATPQSVANEIRREAIHANVGADGHALPLVSHWTTGNHPLSKGWAPAQQMRLIENGHYLLPWFEQPDKDTPLTEGTLAAFRAYYEAPMKRARELHVPVVFVSSQWERFLSQEPYLGLAVATNPNVVTVSGAVVPKVCPFGPVEPWHSVGASLTRNVWMQMLEEWYPDPPLVMFLSNNEHAKLQGKDAEQCGRYLGRYGAGRDIDFRKRVVAEGWVERYRALQQGMRDGLDNAAWRDKALFVGYDAFGVPHFGRWEGWKDASWYTLDRVNFQPLMWDGGSTSFYTHNWNPSTDFTTWSPQVEAMNLVFQQREAYGAKPGFWVEMSVWDGYEPSLPNDKRRYYASLGQEFSPERYAGMVQFGMWLLRPRAVREFRGWTHPWEDGQPYFMAIVHAVDRVHDNPVLREWWRTGQLVPNRAGQHPYDKSIPLVYSREDRWFLLDADVNPRQGQWNLDARIPVFALALSRGVTPHRRWLVYAHAPLGLKKGVRLTVPDYRTITVDVPVAGAFYEVAEDDGRVQEIK